jgi:hypothetical protein
MFVLLAILLTQLALETVSSQVPLEVMWKAFEATDMRAVIIKDEPLTDGEVEYLARHPTKNFNLPQVVQSESYNKFKSMVGSFQAVQVTELFVSFQYESKDEHQNVWSSFRVFARFATKNTMTSWASAKVQTYIFMNDSTVVF